MVFVHARHRGADADGVLAVTLLCVGVDEHVALGHSSWHNMAWQAA